MKMCTDSYNLLKLTFKQLKDYKLTQNTKIYVSSDLVPCQFALS